jgi:uncharacterized protein YndB with AHSA1/START domain
VDLPDGTLALMRWENTVLIDAPADKVWQLTTDISDWPSFSPTMTSVERLDQGPLRVGSAARVKQPGQTAAVWTVTRLEPGRVFTWQARRLGMTMIGTHLVMGSGETCRNTLSIDITGPTAPVFGALLAPLLRTSLARENAGFKTAAERQA